MQEIRINEMKSKKIFVNVITGFGGQLVVIVLGIIVPKIFIMSYGSDVNGLLCTITQIFTYMALLEAGIGQAARNALFKPFQEKNFEDICNIASIARKYYRKFTGIYAVGVFVLALSLPIILKTNVDSTTIILIVLFEGMSGVISFYYTEIYSVILSVDGKSYINNGISLANRITGYIVRIIMANFGISIILLQFAYFIVSLAKVVFYNLYFKRKYTWLKYKKIDNSTKLKDRNSYIITEVASTIFNSTDIIVLSVFLSTQLASVYSIYNMIYSNIHLLLNSVYFSVVYILGTTYHSNIKKYAIVHDSFTSIFLGLMTSLMSVCYMLTVPFVTLYTQGITDVNYIYNELPLLFSLVQILSWSRYVSGNLTGVAGYAKQTSYVSLIEALTNIVLSIIFVKRFGIVGVLFATVIALPLKVLWCIYVSDKKVLHRSFLKSVSIIGINFLFFACVVIFSSQFHPAIASYKDFFVWGIIFTLLFSFLCMSLNFLVNRDCWIILKKYLLKIKK